MKNHILKHTRYFVLFIILLAVAFGGCQRGVRVRGELAMLDSLVDVDYDSALSVLVQLDTRQMGKGERMYAQLLTGKAMNKADSLFTTDSVMKEVVRYFDRHGNSNQRMLAHYVLGCAYRDMGDAPRALQCYQDAVEQADTTRSDCDLSTLMRVHSQMSNIYRKQRLTEFELEESHKGEQLAWILRDTLSALRLQQHICSALYKEKKYKECLEAAKNLQDNCIRCNCFNLAEVVNVTFLKTYLKLHDFDKAKIYLERYETAKTLKENSSQIIGGLGPLYSYKADYFRGISNPDSAEYYYKKALSSQGPGFVPISTYMGLCDIYETTGQVDSLYKYTKLYIAEKEKKYDAEQMSTMVQMQSLYGYNAESRKAEKEMERVAVLKKWGWGTSAAVVLLSLLLWNLRLRKDRKLLALSEEVRWLQKELIEIGEENERSEEIKGMNEELMQTIREKERQIDLLRQRSNESFMGSHAVSVFRQRLATLAPAPEAEWEELEQTVAECFPRYSKAIEPAREIEKQYRLCLLTKCEFTAKEMMVILEVNASYPTQIKKRLLKKLFQQEGSARDFDLLVFKMH